MIKLIEQQFLTGERVLFGAKDIKIQNTIFDNGESPLKESKNISLYNSIFKWKYPLWYSKNILMSHCTLFETARAGIWYTDHISLEDCIIEAPKTFRRSTNINLKTVSILNAEENLWECSNVQMENVVAKGNILQ